MPYDSHSLPLFRDLGMFSLYDIYVYSVQVFIYKFNHKLLPEVFHDFYIANDTIHSHNTRQVNHFHVPIYKTRLGTNTIRSTGVSIGNSLYNVVNQECTLDTYKLRLKHYIKSTNISFLY